MERDDMSVTALSEKDYFCVLCLREYYGHRCCPECRQHIYSTEMKDRDLLTIPVKFAK
ncbi:putative zinc ribbon protein [Citrobacter freundii]|uniref:putative zinc ribbon protein n=2 Tax=Citrobacter freundii TaxID=546 RepID=UPI000ABF9D3B